MTENSEKTCQSYSGQFLLCDWRCMEATEILQLFSDQCRRMHLSYATRESCRGRVQSYIRALAKYPKAWSSEKRAEASRTRLAKRVIAAATWNDSLAPHPLARPARWPFGPASLSCAVGGARCSYRLCASSSGKAGDGGRGRGG